ncbi:MAG: hypothetical protein ACK51F_10620 [Rhodospirillales bacterium]|jgi:hypothetical protein
MSAIDEHDIGDLVELRATFTDAAGVPANPTTVTVRVQKPDGTITTPSAASGVTGTWTATISLDQSGWWGYVFIGAGANAAAEESRLFVRRPLVPRT